MKVCLHCKCEFEKKDWTCPSCKKSPVNIDGKLAFTQNIIQDGIAFDADNFKELLKLEPDSFWFNARNNLITWAIQRYFPYAKSLLEIGCGTGFVLSSIEKKFQDLDTYGSEVHIEGLNIASKRLIRSTLFQMDARNVPFANEFDVIGAFDLLEHIKDDKVVLKEMYKSLKDGGGIILTVPHHPFLWSKLDEVGHHFRRYRMNELKQRVKSCGFHVKRVTSFVSLLLPIIMLSRLRWKKSIGMYDYVSEFKIGALVNFCLRSVLDLEHFMIKLGISFPLGSSLLLIAYKNGDRNGKNTI